MAEGSSIPSGIKWLLGIVVIVAFFWLDGNPKTSATLYLVLGWVARFAVAYAAWLLGDSAFDTSARPRRTAVRAAGIVLILVVLVGLRVGCSTDSDCDPDPFGGCSSTCETVSLSSRLRAMGVLLTILALPVIAAGYKHRRRFLESDASSH